MEKYQPENIEQKLYARWEEAGYFAPSGSGEPYCIMIPPPNVTGTLHMGHAFQHSLVDSLIRFQRMKGRNTLWQMGTDHAGISTQMVVEEQLALEQIKPTDLGREKFLERAWEWKHHSGGTITRQLRRLGASLHWETERFTLDEGFTRAVLETFIRLYDDNLIYRGKRLVNWDPQLATSISDLEVVSEEEQTHLWHFRYPIMGGPVDGREYLVVATTRPETMLGDTALAVHPSDERYKKLIGKFVDLPLTGRQIPIVADHYVDMEFGTGCVKITPAHDFNDYDLGKRHDLDIINVFTEDARINAQAPAAYQGLDRFVARKKVVADLEALGLVDKIEDYKTAIPRGERSGAIIEPYLSDQWFVKVKPLAEPAIKAVEDGRIEFIPGSFANNYFAWMKDIQDWCISRQQWWGHRIPAWYDDQGNLYVAHSESEARTKYDLSDGLQLRQDEDVLDTWFSSQLWTFATLGWPDSTDALKTWHPTDVMVTAHDIITFWVARMIMIALKFTDEVPFRKVYIHGLVTDAHGNKMSKSKGNGLDPLDIIDGITLDELVAKRTRNLMQPRMAERIAKATRKEYPQGIAAYGTDALRFTFCAIATRSRTIKFDMNRVEGYRNFCNKLWNAANFVMLHTSDEYSQEKALQSGEAADRWMISTLQRRTKAITEAMETYRFDLAARNLYELVWDEFCDWYLELSKPMLQGSVADIPAAISTRHTLISVLRDILRLAHPFIPFITEEIWLKLPCEVTGRDNTLVLESYPQEDLEQIDIDAEQDMQWVMDVVTGTRNIRGEMNISFARKIPVLFANGNDIDQRRLAQYGSLLEALIKSESLTWREPGESVPVSATHLVGELQVLVPMAGIIDRQAELERLDKEIARKQADIKRAQAKISNPSFVEKAPRDVVDSERLKLRESELALEKLGQQRDRIASI